MGFNIAGLVIDRNYGREFSKLEDDILWDLEIIEEINFGEASSNWTPEGECRVYFSDRATLIFYPHSWVTERYHSHTGKSMSYAYSATAMTFFISYSDVKNRQGRFLISNEGEFTLAEGSKLEYEDQGMSADAMIWQLIEDICGQSFHSIDHDEKAYRCRKINPATTRLKYLQKEKPAPPDRVNTEPKSDPDESQKYATLNDQEKRDLGKKRVLNALIIGFMFGIIMYSIFNQNVGFFLLIPLIIIYKLVNG